jgi:hypothetical protein
MECGGGPLQFVIGHCLRDTIRKGEIIKVKAEFCAQLIKH